LASVGGRAAGEACWSRLNAVRILGLPLVDGPDHTTDRTIAAILRIPARVRESIPVHAFPSADRGWAVSCPKSPVRHHFARNSDRSGPYFGPSGPYHDRTSAV